MFISFACFVTSLCSTSVNLADVVNDYKDDATMIELKSGYYFATDLRLTNRNITFYGVEDHVYIDLREYNEMALELLDSSITFVSITLIPSQASIFASATQSTLNLTSCWYYHGALSHPIMEGSNSRLIIDSCMFTDLIFTESLIRGIVDETDTNLSLSVSNSYFERIDVQAQKPILAGPDVLTVSMSTTRFKDITCTETGDLPETKIEGVPNRAVSFEDSRFENVTAPLSGVVVFGVQASKLNLRSVIIHNVDNAVRFSDNVEFASDIVVRLEWCETRNTTTTDFWRHGGFLYLPHNSSQLYITNSNAHNSSALKGSGGWIFARECRNLTMDQCSFEYTYARDRGGLFCVYGEIDRIDMLNVDVVHSKSELEGGVVFVEVPKSVEVSNGRFAKCHSSSQGGVFNFENCDGASFAFKQVKFDSNWAGSRYGMDVLFSYSISTTYSVSKANFENCTSTSRKNRVSIRPFNNHIDWTNTAGLAIHRIMTGVGIGSCVVLGVLVTVTCVCCCCGCCVACGCGRRKSKEYSDIEVQPKDTYRPAPQYQGQYLPHTGYPQQWAQGPNVFVQPVTQPVEFQQNPLCPANQVGTAQTISKD
ncbi:hypothetical protein BLNAU_14508 [Blattamonas nauphoetae]|uniref:Right handed beta helix domain-containing protein n=1 Tax=Blattamonas nauphoetae TaxID=2049346 RepID=A0ABQ9XK44_9EUKA|nr:hypothetical protein BLNAU_14508 [Blattamonas nauphoetae]